MIVSRQVLDLALAAGRLVISTDGEERLRPQRQAVLDALEAIASGMDARQGGNEVPSSDDSPTAESGDALK